MTQEEIKKALKRLREKCCSFTVRFDDLPIAQMYKDFVVMSIDDIINDITEECNNALPLEVDAPSNVQPITEDAPEKPKRNYKRHKPSGVRILRKSLDGKIIYGGYDTIAEASRMTGINRNGIDRCIAGAKESWGGYIWTRVPYTPNTPKEEKEETKDDD